MTAVAEKFMYEMVTGAAAEPDEAGALEAGWELVADPWAQAVSANAVRAATAAPRRRRTVMGGYLSCSGRGRGYLRPVWATPAMRCRWATR